MNFEVYNKDYLIQVSKNKDLLHDEIIKTFGFVLEMMSNENIFPEISLFYKDDLLVNNEAVFFILKNYKLNKKQMLNFFSLLDLYAQKDEDEIKSLVINDEDMIFLLKNKLSIPNLPLNISENFLIDNESLFYHLHDDEGLTTKILGKINTPENYMKINKIIIGRGFELSDKVIEWFNNNEEFRTFITENVLNNSNSSKVFFKNLQQITKISFREDDKYMLKNLISNNFDDRFSYDDILKIPSISKIISLYDYLDTILKNQNLLIKKEWFTGSNIEDISNYVKNLLFVNNERYENRGAIYEIVGFNNIDIDTFKELFNKNFLKELLLMDKSFLHNLNHELMNCSQNRLGKITYLLNTTIDILAEDVALLKNIDMGILVKLVETNGNENLKKLLENNFSTIFSNENLYSLFNVDLQSSEWFNKFLITNFKNNKVSFNMLFYILEICDNMADRDLQEELYFFVKEVGKYFSNEDLKILSEKYVLPKTFFNKFPKVENNFNKEHNILALDIYKEKSVTSNTLRLLFSLNKKNMENKILKNKILLPEDLLVSLSSDFISSYIKINKEHIIKNHNKHSSLIQKFSSVIYEGISLEEVKDEIIKLYNRNVDISKHLDDIKKKYNIKVYEDGEIISSYGNSGEGFKLYESQLELKNDNDSNIVKVFEKLTVEFQKKIIRKLIENKNFEILLKVSENHSIKKIVKECVFEMSYTQIIEESHDNFFKRVIYSLCTKNLFDGTSFLNVCSEKQAYAVYEALRGDNKDLNRGLLSIFNIKKIGDDFFKNIVVRESNSQSWYDYSYIPNRWKMDFGKYSNAQIIEMFNNLKKDGLFKTSGVNDHLGEFLLHNYIDNKDDSFRKKEFEELLKYAENNDSILYIVLLQRTLLEKCINIDVPSDVVKDEYKATMFFKEKVDVDVVIDGISKVLKLIKGSNNEQEFSLKIAHEIIGQVIYSSYYEILDSYNYVSQRMSNTNLTEDQSKKLLNFFLKEEPLLLNSYTNMGKYNISNMFIDNNILRKELDIEKILKPNANAINDELFSNRKNNIFEVINNYIKNSFENGEVKNLQFIKYLIDKEKLGNSIPNYDYWNFIPLNPEARTDQIIKLLCSQNITETIDSYISKIDMDRDLKTIKVAKVNTKKKI